MADKNDTAKVKKVKGKRKKRLDISARAIIDNIVFSKTDQTAYYRITNTVYDFISAEAKVASAERIINAFVALMSDRQEKLECQIIIPPRPLNVPLWEEQVNTLSQDWPKGPGFEQYMEEQAKYLEERDYMYRETILGINIGKRGALDFDASNIVDLGVRGALDVAKNWLDKALQVPGEEISAREEMEARRREENFYRTLSTGNLRAERCTAEELLLRIKRELYPAMPVPDLDIDHENRIGPGDLELELTSAIRNKLRYVSINQMIGVHELEGYRATLTISSLPKYTSYPLHTFPFMYYLTQSFPFTSYAHFTLLPTGAMKKELEKKKKEMKDELENLAGAGDTNSSLGIMPTDVMEARQDVSTMSDMLQEGKMPWVEGTYRIAVEAVSEEALKDYCSAVKQHYADLDINVNWTIGDQASLLLEGMPGDKLRSRAHQQVTNLIMFGTSGFNFSSDVGDILSEGVKDTSTRR